ncbi:MAG TPA: chaperone NapD [Gammaproteobacteria bacterium]|nr:chaperone NapD [Gammaproteobacteria bacterium]
MITPTEVHISSMVVHATPDGLQAVKAKIERLRGVEIHAESECGKLVVVLESDSQSQITDVIDRINGFAQVLGTALVYHQIEPLEPQGNETS